GLVAQYNAGRDTSYSAALAIKNLNVGSLLGDTTLGEVSFNADVKGTSLDPRKMVAEGEATLVSAEAMGYTYKDIKVDFNANAGDILANLVSNDPNLAVVMNAQAEWRDKYPSLLVNASLDSLNLKNLKLTNDDIRYRG